MYLARDGWRVRVFERRPEPGPASTSRQRSWVLAMYPRGIRPVQSVASVPLLAERAYKGLVVVPPKPGAKPVVLERTGVLMDRTLLATSLLDAARGQYASRVEFSFQSTLRDIKVDRKLAVFAADSSPVEVPNGGAERPDAGGGGGPGGATGSDGGVMEVPYDLLVGADGANSTVRSLLAAAFPGQFDAEVLGSGVGADDGPGAYKAVYGLPSLPAVVAWAPDSGAPESERLAGEFFFFLSGGTKGFMSVCRDIDGTFCGYLAGSATLFDGLKTREDYLAALPAAAPQLPPEWAPLVADKLMAAPVSRFPVMRSLTRFWAPGGVVLLGDAAHTVTPALGQGLNSALQDCELLAAELRAGQAAASSSDPDSGSALDAALRRFSEARAPEVRALQELELLQSASLARLDPAAGLPRLLPLLARKWLLLQYSGLALLGAVAATAAAEGRRKQRQRQQAEGGGAADTAAAAGAESPLRAVAAGGGGGGGGMEAAQQAVADALGAQLDATYVRSPPMYELLRGHMGYRDMLVRLYGMAALGTGITAALLYGIGLAAAAAAARALGG